MNRTLPFYCQLDVTSLESHALIHKQFPVTLVLCSVAHHQENLSYLEVGMYRFNFFLTLNGNYRRKFFLVVKQWAVSDFHAKELFIQIKS